MSPCAHVVLALQRPLRPGKVRGDEPVELRAFRGNRRAPTCDEHVMPEDLFLRIVLLGKAYDLHQLSALDPYGPTEFIKEQARRLAEEARFIGGVVNDPLLAPHLSAVGRVVDYCWRHTGDSWLVIEGP